MLLSPFEVRRILRLSKRDRKTWRSNFSYCQATARACSLSSASPSSREPNPELFAGRADPPGLGALTIVSAQELDPSEPLTLSPEDEHAVFGRFSEAHSQSLANAVPVDPNEHE